MREEFHDSAGFIERSVAAGPYEAKTAVRRIADAGLDLAAAWDQSVLRGSDPMACKDAVTEIRIGDLFCGAGGLTNGSKLACEAIGLKALIDFGVDEDEEALGVYRRNFRPTLSFSRSVGTLVDFQISGEPDCARFSYEPEVVEDQLARRGQGITTIVAGPPCQGHSNLNNHTRRDDPRNLLYLAVPAIAVALGAKSVIIENVPDVRQDTFSVFTTACSLLKSEGYHIDSHVIDATKLGVPQTRKRLILVASRSGKPDLARAVKSLRRDERNVMFAIGDIAKECDTLDSTFAKCSSMDEVSRSRIAYLFDNNLHNLPNDQRPECHQNGHSYPSVYGRMYEDKPSGTITQGFNSIGRGRFIHPHMRRPITPHEAARIQGLSDSFTWESGGEPLTRSSLAKLIGNAVPPVMGYAAMLAILETFCDGPEMPIH